MENLTIQNETFENIKKLCANYKKDGASRKTPDYLTKRLVSLENQWTDFYERHQELLTLEDKNIQYFQEAIFEKTNFLYEETRKDILRLLTHSSTLLTASPKPEGQLLSCIATENSTPEKAKELLEQQECNFNAITRVMSKINISKISEKWELEDYLNILRSKWEAVDKMHWQIENLLKGTKPTYTERYNSIEYRYDELKRQINSKIWANAHYRESTPRIEIPEFDGSYNKWISFKDIFLDVIHNNPTISKAQKIKHLKTKLKGEAEKIVQHLNTSSENYDACWAILEQRYDNRRLLFTSYMNTMMNLPTIQYNSLDSKKMHDVIIECVNGLQNIGLDTTTWDPIIVYLMSQKLDQSTFNEYIKGLADPREVPRLEEFTGFLESKFNAIESMKNRQKEVNFNSAKQPITPKRNYAPNRNYEGYRREMPRTHYIGPTYLRCPHCDGTHVLMQCPKFVDMNSFQRNNLVTKLRVCKNCLFSHGDQNCTSTKTCKECNRKHHTLLHNFNNDMHQSKPTNTNNKYNYGQRPSSSSMMNRQSSSNHVNKDEDIEVLLTTALLNIKTSDGSYITLRALLDQGSQVNIITEQAAQILRLPRRKMNATLHGIGTVAGDCKGQLTLECKSIHADYAFNIEAFIMKKMINNLPNSTFEKKSWPYLDNIKLADPDYNISRPVDLLLGADVYANIITEGVLKGSSTSPTAQQTLLGWILCGKMKTFNCYVTTVNLKELTHFWENEDIIQTSEEIPKDDHCELYYQKTTKRAKNGSYIVKMPLTDDYKQKLGNSKSTAIAQYLQLERKLTKNNKLSTMYTDFINEYRELQHLKPADSENTIQCFLPHHGVLREHSTTTKLRVVFNASQKTSTGYSLNDVMEKGPNLQKDIQGLLLKWRSYQYVFTADIEKFYRCIWLSEDQQQLQKIIWRDNKSSNSSLQELQLRTITYGTKSAPWLAMRTLKQLAIDDGDKYPAAANVLQNDFYCDDLLSGHNSKEKAKEIQITLIKILQGAGMNLRKWASNDNSLLQHLPIGHVSKNTIIDFKTENNMKTLGLGWNPQTDNFLFNWETTEQKDKLITKRHLLSEISKLYDPLGWLAPITVTAKLLFQKVWLNKLNWDEVLPESIQSEWKKLKAELPEVKDFRLTRWIGSNNKNIQLHGYCDASEKAYACVIYCVTKNNDVSIVTLLTAKTRVVPTSQKVTLPRLELCGALLLAKLMEKVQNAFKTYNITTHGWCDSQVVLAWIQGETSRREVYIANRVEKVIKVIPPQQWRYIKSEENPADCASRGLLPRKLKDFKLWWHGPESLKTPNLTHENESSHKYTTNLEEIKQTCSTLTQYNDNNNIINYLLQKYSAMTRVQRVLAWIMRFINNLRRNAMKCNTAYLNIEEINRTEKQITKHVQLTNYRLEYELLQKNKTLTKKSKLYNLNPYIDETGILRVGGRLVNSSLPFNMKHPAILPNKHRVTTLIIDQAHLQCLHGGARLTQAIIREQYWIVGGNRAVKAHISHCIRCHRFKPTKNHQIMGNLPPCRITPSRPFTHTGIDYTGHVDVKLNKGRGVKTSKGYIVIFICMATKAVHIELASDMTTETFIAAFQRMCARRGTPSHVYTDCGTNFVGAAKLLTSNFQNFLSAMPSDFMEKINKLQVQWHFNAPAWPTAGGLWEAAVKSMKHHLRRTLGEQKLTYEEFTTLLSKIEACMNSRPLCPLTEDPEEFFNYLTPGHFLTGQSTMLLPETVENYANMNLRKRWQLTNNMWLQYWKCWSSEYLTQLQARTKWQNARINVKNGDIVLIKEDNLPPGKWAMGRIIELHPGRDGYVRVTTLKTQNGIIKRPITKLSPLPIEAGDLSNYNNTQTMTQEQPRITHRGGIKKSLALLFSTLMAFALMLPAHCQQLTTSGISTTGTTQLTHIENTRPVYYDALGTVEFLHDEWTVLLYYNLTTYWEGTNQIHEFMAVINNTCKKLDPKLCETTVTQLYNELESLDYYNSILLSPHKHLTSRKKRGLINGIGYITNDLFGILDQRFAEKYEQDIKAVQENEDYLLELNRNQTSLIELENEALRKNEQNMKAQLTMLNSYLHEINASLATMQLDIELIMASNYFSSSALTAHLLTNNLKTIQDLLVNTLMDTYKGHMDIHFFKPTDLMKKLQEISRSLPKALTIPRDIKNLYQLMYVRARVTDNFLLCEIHIPLTRDDEFTLYKIYPLPMHSKDKQRRWATITSSHIAINFEKNTYATLQDHDLSQCGQRNSDTYTCGVNLPIYNLHSDNAPCEIKLLLGQSPTSTCKTTTNVCKDTWIELHTINTWLWICCDKCKIHILCNNDVTSYVTNTSLILTLEKGCTVQTDGMNIFGRSNYYNKIKVNPEVPILPLDKGINRIVSLILNEVSLNTSSSNESVLQEAEVYIKQQKERERKLPNDILSTHDIHQYVLGYATLSLLLSGTTLWLGTLCWRRQRRARGPARHTKDEQKEPQGIQTAHHVYATTETTPRNPQHRDRDVVFNI